MGVPCAINTISNAMKPPEYARSSVVVMVPIAARPTWIPDMIASFTPIWGFFSTTSLTAEVISTAISIMAPLAPIKILAMKICVRFRCSNPAYKRLSEYAITAPCILKASVKMMPRMHVVSTPSRTPAVAARKRLS